MLRFLKNAFTFRDNVKIGTTENEVTIEVTGDNDENLQITNPSSEATTTVQIDTGISRTIENAVS